MVQNSELLAEPLRSMYSLCLSYEVFCGLHLCEPLSYHLLDFQVVLDF